MIKFFIGLIVGILLGNVILFSLLYIYAKKQQKKKYLGSRYAVFIPNKKGGK